MDDINNVFDGVTVTLSESLVLREKQMDDLSVVDQTFQ
jgi:hypothetical protein